MVIGDEAPVHRRITRARPRDPGHAPILGNRWRDMPLDSELFFYALAADEGQNARVFSIQFFHTVHQTLNQGVTPLQHRLAQRLRANVRNTPWFFVIEITESEIVHVHGILNPAGETDGNIKRALKKAAGDARKIKTSGEHFFFHCKAVDYGPVDWSEQYGGNVGPYGWAKYMSKNAERTKKVLNLPRAPVSAQLEIRRRARAIYEEDLAAARALNPDR